MTETIESTITGDRKVVYLKRVFEILVKIFTQQNSSDHLITLITKYSQTTETNIKKALMYLIEISCEYSFDDTQLMQHSQQISTIFMHYLEDQDPLVQSLTLKSLVTFLNSIQEEANLKKFSDVFPLLISKCVQCLKADEESGLNSLSSLTDLIETHPKFVKQITNDFLNLFTEILDSFTSAPIRIKALTGIVTLCATNNTQVRKSDIFKQKTVISIMKLMTESSQLSLEEWTEELEDNKLSQNDAASAAEESLAKIGYELGNKFLFPLFAPLIREALLNNGQWNVQCAGLNAIAQLAEESKGIIKTEDLQNLIMMIKQAADTHQANPRVQYAALTAFSLLAGEYTPELQDKYGEIVLQCILKNLDSANIKLQYRAIQSIINYCKDLENENTPLNTYAETLLQKISVIFQKNLTNTNQRLLEETLVCISTIALTLQKHFTSFYNSFMPGLQNLLNTLPRDTIQQISIRVHTIECIGYLLTSIKDNVELFQKDCALIMNSLINMQKQIAGEKDDLHHPPILVVYGQIAEAMQTDFAHYLSQVFPFVFQGLTMSIDAKIDETITAQPSTSTNGKIQKVTFDLHMLGGLKTLELNTAALEQKIEAFHTLYQIANATKTAFYPFAQQTLEVLLQHISYKNSKAIKENSIKTLTSIFNCLPAQERPLALTKVAPFILEQFKNALKIQNDEEVALIIANFAEYLKTIQTLDGQNVDFGTQMISCLSESLTLCKTLKKEIVQEYANEDMDEATQEEFEEKYDEANEIMQNMIDMIGQLVRLFPTLENTVVNNLLPDFFDVFAKDVSTDSELNTVLCTFDEFLQYCSSSLFDKAFTNILTKFIEYAKNYQDSNVKQSSIFGIGVCAKRASNQQFTPFLNSALETLNELYVNTQGTVFENVIACIFKIAFYQVNDKALKNTLLLKALEKLPIKEDLEEACNLHEFLCILYKEQNACFADIMPQVKNTLLSIKQYQEQNTKEQILNEETKKYIQTL